MKIGFNFHSTDDYISGVEYYSLGLICSLLNIDHKNQYTVFTNKPELVISYTGSHDNLAIRDCSFLKNRPYRILWEHLVLPSLVDKEKLDILHCPHYICPAVKNEVSYVITIHDTIAIDHPQWCKRSNALYYKRFLSRSVKAAAKIIAVSQFTIDRLIHNFNVNGSKVELIYPGIDENIFCDNQDFKRQKQVRKQYNLPESYILYCGNIEPKKNILNLLKVFSLFKLAGLKQKLVISGQRSWRSRKIFNFLHKKFKPDEVILTGYIDREDLGVVFKIADCLVLPSFCEGFGFPVLEAFASGVPVAASDVGVLPEIDKNAYTKLEPQNVMQMAESIYQLLTDNKLRDMQIKTAKKEVQKFTWSDCAIKTLKLYTEVLNTNG